MLLRTSTMGGMHVPLAFVSVRWRLDAEDSGLSVKLSSGHELLFPVMPAQVTTDEGLLSSFLLDGDVVMLRPLQDVDGEWISQYRMCLPREVLELLVTSPADQHDDHLSARGEEVDWDLAVVTHLIYHSGRGPYQRIAGAWVKLRSLPYDDGMVCDLNPTRAQGLLKRFDRDPKISFDDLSDFMLS